MRRWLRRDYPAIAARAKARAAPSSGVTRPACAPTTCAAAATPRGPHAGGAGQPQAGQPRPDLGGDQQGRVALDGAGRRGQGPEPAPLPRPPGPGCRAQGLPHPRPPAGPPLGQVRDWLAGHRPRSRCFYLPGYSPELNPDEGVNGDLKQAVPRKAPARSKAQLKRAAIGHMRRLSKRPDRVRSFFRHRFRYAA